MKIILGMFKNNEPDRIKYIACSINTEATCEDSAVAWAKKFFDGDEMARKYLESCPKTVEFCAMMPENGNKYAALKVIEDKLSEMQANTWSECVINLTKNKDEATKYRKPINFFVREAPGKYRKA